MNPSSRGIRRRSGPFDGRTVTVEPLATSVSGAGRWARTDPLGISGWNRGSPRAILSRSSASAARASANGHVHQVRHRPRGRARRDDEGDLGVREHLVAGHISWSVPAEPALVAGDEVLPDTEVALVVSSGPAPRTVPNLVNMPVRRCPRRARRATAEVRSGRAAVPPRDPQGIGPGPATGSRHAGGAGLDGHRPRCRRAPTCAGCRGSKDSPCSARRERLRDAGLRVGRAARLDPGHRRRRHRGR